MGALHWHRQIPARIVAGFSYMLAPIGLVLVLKYAGIDLLSILAATR